MLRKHSYRENTIIQRTNDNETATHCAGDIVHPSARAHTGRHSGDRRRFLQFACGFVVTCLFGSMKLAVAIPITEDQLAGEPLPPVITGGGDHIIKHWDVNGRLLGTIGTHREAITTLAVNHGVLISGEADGKLKAWNLTTGKQDFDQKAHTDGFVALAVTPDGALLATGGGDSVIRLWDGHTGRFLNDFPKAHSGGILAMQFTADGTRLVTGGADRMVREWTITGDSKRPGIQYHSNIVAHDEAISAIAVSTDDKYIASVSSDGFLKIWSLHGGGLVQRVRLGAAGLTVLFSADNKTVATGDADGKIRLWNVETGAPLPFVGSHERGVTALAWTSDGKILISGGEDKTLRYWDTMTNRQIVRITAHDGAVRAIALP